MKIFGGNSGYIGYSMSKRAAEAYSNGSLPKSKFSKEYKVPARMWDTLRSIQAVTSDGWHHTSKFGNRTYFYSWMDDEVRNIWVSRRKELINIFRMSGKQPRLADYPITREGVAEYDKEYGKWQEKHREAVGLIKDILLQD